MKQIQIKELGTERSPRCRPLLQVEIETIGDENSDTAGLMLSLEMGEPFVLKWLSYEDGDTSYPMDIEDLSASQIADFIKYGFELARKYGCTFKKPDSAFYALLEECGQSSEDITVIKTLVSSLE